MFDFFSIKRDGIVFVSKDFVGTNNKVLFIETFKKYTNTLILTDNKKQIEEFNNSGLKASLLGTIFSFYKLARAKIVIQDQGNSNYIVKHLSFKQKKYREYLLPISDILTYYLLNQEVKISKKFTILKLVGCISIEFVILFNCFFH